MYDEDLAVFLEDIGHPTERVPATPEEIERYRGILPDQLLSYWKLLGFSGFAQGLFWITNPADFTDIVDNYLEPTTLADHDTFHVIARSAYGELYLWGKQTGSTLTIIPYLNWIKISVGDAEEIATGQADQAIRNFLAFQEIKAIDLEVKSKPFFPKVLKKHGPVGPDKVITFAPYLFMGGKKSINNTHKEDLHTFLQIVADMGNAEIIDMASMVKGVMQQYGEG